MRSTIAPKILYLLLVAALALTLPGPTALPVQAGPSYKLIVDHAGDASGQACTAAPGDCSLRSAIELANAYPGAMDVDILFDADYTIVLGGNLPTITRDNLSIQGTDNGGTLHVVKINRNAADNCPDGGCQVMVINATNVDLYNLRLYGSGPGSANIWITGSAQDVTIMNSVIGDDDPARGGCGDSPYSHSGIYIDATGTLGPDLRVMIVGNIIECNAGSPGGYGIVIYYTDGVSIGVASSDPTTYRNHIRLNSNAGIQLVGAHDNLILGNYLGVNATGSAAAANGGAGISAYFASSTAITDNLISGNSGAGVWLYDTQAITITHNYIGTNVSGTAAIPNGHDGVALTDGARGNRVGGWNAADRNLISGNTFCGVRIRDAATANYVDGNGIGLNAAGNGAIPNGEAGVCIFDANSNYIGSASWYGVYQHISGNTREGIYVEKTSGTFIGHSNYVGVASDRVTPLGNGLAGVMLVNTMNTSVYASIVAYNGGAGVAVTGYGAAGNKIQPNIIRSNGGLPVDLGNDGPTPNDPGDSDSGPNDLLNYPVITGSSGSTVSGTACKDCIVLIYPANGNPAAAGGGGTYWQQVTADAFGNWNFTLSGGLTPANISMMACESPCVLTGNTSEMSPVTAQRVFLPIVLK